MDTQRLILFVIFSFSALFLWERWQSEHRPPVAPAAHQPLPTTGVDAPVPGGAMPPILPATVPGVAATSAPSEKVVIKTDLYTAAVDTLGAVLSEVALTTHRDTNDEN